MDKQLEQLVKTVAWLTGISILGALCNMLLAIRMNDLQNKQEFQVLNQGFNEDRFRRLFAWVFPAAEAETVDAVPEDEPPV